MVHVVGAAIVRDGLVLVARRGPGRQLAGLWEFPGGKVEPGESPITALSREIHEELGIDIHVGPHIDTTTQVYPFATVTLETYIATIDSGDPVASEHSEIRWCGVSELDQLDWAPADVSAAQKIVATMRIDKHPRSQT